jgi:predicted ribosome quality control (RQC) complex YloA/Tae2 family protein
MQDTEQASYLASLLTAVENALEEEDLEALSVEWADFTASEDPRGSGSTSTGMQKKSRVKKGSNAGGKKKPGAREPVRKPAGSNPRRYRSSDGFDILVGRNNIQNDRLPFKTADRDDIWLHIQKEPGTHVIIRTGRREVPERTLLEAAQIAAWFSRPGRKEAMRPVQGDGAMVSVDYCPVAHVRKMSGARPGW